MKLSEIIFRDAKTDHKLVLKAIPPSYAGGDASVQGEVFFGLDCLNIIRVDEETLREDCAELFWSLCGYHGTITDVAPILNAARQLGA